MAEVPGEVGVIPAAVVPSGRAGGHQRHLKKAELPKVVLLYGRASQEILGACVAVEASAVDGGAVVHWTLERFVQLEAHKR